MNFKKLFGPSHAREDGRKVRYAIVGAGWIAQEDFMPGIGHTGNSEQTAIITGDQEKARILGDKYGIKHLFDYDHYDEALRSGTFDAVYLAVPNSRHRDLTVRALEGGVHVLLEKPMAPNEADCLAMIAAQEKSGAKLMVAYRLHFDEATLSTLELLQSGRIGEPRFFSSSFGQQVSGDNSRANAREWAGPLPDMGTYPINAARLFFGAEPIEAIAFADSLEEPRFAEIDEMMSVTLRFPGNRLAQFLVSYGVNSVNDCRIAGTKGDVRLSPAFAYDKPIERWITAGDQVEHTKFPHRDQFGGETKYFSDCILDGKNPEPDGHEGLADIRVIKAIEEALHTSGSVQIRGGQKVSVPSRDQIENLPAVEPGELVHAAPPEG